MSETNPPLTRVRDGGPEYRLNAVEKLRPRWSSGRRRNQDSMYPPRHFPLWLEEITLFRRLGLLYKNRIRELLDTCLRELRFRSPSSRRTSVFPSSISL